jgi:hypothetical protein
MNGPKTILGRIAVGSATIVAALALFAAPAVAAAQDTTPTNATASTVHNNGHDTVLPSPCGWYTDWTATAWYNHCGPGRVVIHVDVINAGGWPDYDKCVGPGDTWLGSWPNVQGAWYAGRTC